MSKITNPLRAEYLAHIIKQRESGISLRKYCEENSLKEHLMSYYRKYKLKVKNKSIPKSFSKIEIQKTDEVNSRVIQTSGVIDPVWLAKFINSLAGKK